MAATKTAAKKPKAAPKGGQGVESAAKMIDGRIESLMDWRGPALARIRKIIKSADPGVVEEW